jgi:hypothetical protein
MAERLRSLEWCRFHYDDELWRVMLTTPTLAPSFLPEMRSGAWEAACHYEIRTIYIDAGFPPAQLAETLHHEFHHVGRDGRRQGSEDHRFFAESSPIVVGIYAAIGIDLCPPLPDGWERLHKSSRRWHAKREWSK